MTTLYKPVRIESAEQAEALPIGTYAVLWNTCRIAVKVRAVQWDAESGSYGNRDMLMAEALVPIEAEEEWGSSRPNGGAWECHNRSHAESDADGWNSAGPGGFQSAPVRRLVTPWEPQK